jgi:hypothetical protein
MVRGAVVTYWYVIYEGRLKSSWTHRITPNRNFVEVRWRSLFRSTSLGKRCASYNAPPTFRKRAADRWSLRNFLPRSSLFMVGKAQNRMGRDLTWIRCSVWKKWSGGTPLEHPCWATGWTIGVLGFDSRRGLGIFLFTTVSRTALGPTQPPIQ